MTQPKKIPWLPLLFLLASPPLAPATARAAEPPKGGEIGNYRKEGIDVVQRRLFRKSMRHEFSVDGGFNPTNQFLMYELLGVKYTFHFRETFAFEAFYSYLFHQNKAIIDDLANATCPEGTPAGTDCSVQLDPPPDPTKQIFFGNLVWSPIYGKFSLFSKKIYHFDMYLVAGAGMFDNERSNPFAFDVGLGMKVYGNDWFAVRLDFRNYTVREREPYDHIINNQVLSAGVSFFLPTKPYE